jgi:hypothetical protein
LIFAPQPATLHRDKGGPMLLTGNEYIESIRDGRRVYMEATLEGLIMGQINTGEAHPNGYQTVNRRYVYAALQELVELAKKEPAPLN